VNSKRIYWSSFIVKVADVAFEAEQLKPVIVTVLPSIVVTQPVPELQQDILL